VIWKESEKEVGYVGLRALGDVGKGKEKRHHEGGDLKGYKKTQNDISKNCTEQMKVGASWWEKRRGPGERDRDLEHWGGI